MRSLFTALLAIILPCTGLLAQSADLVVFSEAGELFTLVVDGQERNQAPASRVVATGIRNTTPQVLVRFAGQAGGELKQNAWMEPGLEYTFRITTNRKGERVFRMQGTAPQGTAAAAAPSERTRPVDFQDDPVLTDGAAVDPNEQDRRPPAPVSDRTRSQPRLRPHAVRNSQLTGSFAQGHRVSANNGNTPYHMPGYTGPVGCAQAPLTSAEFEGMLTAVGDKAFEDARMSTAKTTANNRCFTAEQVKQLMDLFHFEDSRLDFAKFAYDRTHDIGNYHKVKEAFRFESSVEELDKYIRSR